MSYGGTRGQLYEYMGTVYQMYTVTWV